MLTSVKTAVGGNGLRNLKWNEVCKAVGADATLWNHVRTVDSFCAEELGAGHLSWKGLLRELGYPNVVAL